MRQIIESKKENQNIYIYMENINEIHVVVEQSRLKIF